MLAAAFLWFGRHYKLGTASRMGPGYFPFFLSLGLGGMGLVAVARSFLMDGEPVDHFAWKPLALIIGSCIAFGLLIKGAGLVVALVVLCLMSAAASAYFAFNAKALVGMALLVLGCSLVFVKGLGVPIPIFGAWFGNGLPAWLVR